jgi:hypothetical protein
VFVSIARLHGFIHYQSCGFGRLFDKFQELLAGGGIVVFGGGIRQQDQPSLGEERHGIDRVVQVVLAHCTRVEARCVHVRTGGVVEIGLEVLEFTRDGEFVVAEEEEEVGHIFFYHEGHEEHQG